jgi:hypothetical protein
MIGTAQPDACDKRYCVAKEEGQGGGRSFVFASSGCGSLTSQRFDNNQTQCQARIQMRR